jgi:hypothetical protein
MARGCQPVYRQSVDERSRPDADPDPSNSDHAKRVHGAFDALQERLAGRLDTGARESLTALRTAAARRDAGRMRAELEGVQQHHGWLYRELAEHPQVAMLLDELALWGI